MNAKKPAQYAPTERNFYYLRLDELGREHRNDVACSLAHSYAMALGYCQIQEFRSLHIEQACGPWPQDKEPHRGPPPGDGWTIAPDAEGSGWSRYQRPMRTRSQQIKELYLLWYPMPEGSIRVVVHWADIGWVEIEQSQGYLERRRKLEQEAQRRIQTSSPRKKWRQ